MDINEDLISLVKQHPILYDLSHKDHKNSKKRDQVWEEISEELCVETDELKKKWKNLRDMFLRYIKKREGGKCTKKWYWAPQMESFNPPLTFAKTDATEIPSKYTVSQSYGQNDAKVEPDSDPIEADTEFKVEFVVEPVSVESPINSNFLPEVEDYPKKSKSKPPPAQNCSTKPITESSLSIKEKRLTSSVNSLVKTYNDIKKDDFDDIDMLFLAHARTIKKFSKKRQAIAKMKISQVIMQQELKNLEEELSKNLNHQECFQDEQSRYASNCELEDV